MIKSMRQQQGFTLIEIMVILVILVILSVFAVSSYSGQQKKARVSAAIEKLVQLDGFMAQERLKGKKYDDIALPFTKIKYSDILIYEVSISEKSTNTYKLTATYKTPSVEDVMGCQQLSIDYLGTKTSTVVGDAVKDCWAI